jgi:predicted ArsR family transcriptional regulator
MDRAAQSDALAQASRARLFRALSELQRPAGTAELAELLGLHPNGVRAHLERLSDAGLVVREREHRPRGRPRDSWSIDPAVGPGADPPRAYADLSRWLLRGLAARKGVSRKAVEATGREVGQELAGDGEAGAPEERMHRALATLGFRPERSVTRDGKLNYTLANCPYREAVRENQPVVCALHRGLTRGLIDGISPSTQLTAFVPHDPDAAGCLIQVEGPLADEVAERSAAASASRRPTP